MRRLSLKFSAVTFLFLTTIVGSSISQEVLSGNPTSASNATLNPSARLKFKNNINFNIIPWNSLEGLGILYSHRATPQVVFEGGAGLSALGLKYGIRSRYLFTPNTVSPFVGIGFMQGSGADDLTATLESGSSEVEINYDLKPINFLQFTTGIDIVTRPGFSVLLVAGWAKALNEGVENVLYDGMTESEYLRSTYIDAADFVDIFDKMTDILYRGGFVLEIGAGISF